MPISEDRPLITIALFAYNQQQLIAEAVLGVISQTYSPLEIILSDDCSSDRTFEIMQELASAYTGSNEVIVRRNEHNLGLIGHINEVMELVHGELIVAAAGDDISLPNRVERIFQEYIGSGRRACSIFSNAIWIDENGSKMNLLHKNPVNQEDLEIENYASRTIPGFVTGATHAWKCDTFIFFGPLAEDIGAEDSCIPFRSALLGEIRYIHEPLVYYRRDANRIRHKNDGSASFLNYRERWLRQKKHHLAMYRARIRDIDKYHKNYKKINSVKQITISHINELECLIKISQSNPREIINLLVQQRHLSSLFRFLRVLMKLFFRPLFEFTVILAYFEYQNAYKRGFLKS